MVHIAAQTRPAVLTGGKFHIINLETFLNALSTTFSYFSVLINVVKKDENSEP